MTQLKDLSIADLVSLYSLWILDEYRKRGNLNMLNTEQFMYINEELRSRVNGINFKETTSANDENIEGRV